MKVVNMSNCKCEPTCVEAVCRDCEACSSNYISSRMPDYWQNDDVSSAIHELWHATLDWHQWQAVLDALEEQESGKRIPERWVNIAQDLDLPLPDLELEVWLEDGGADAGLDSSELFLAGRASEDADYVFSVENDLSRYLDDIHISTAIDEKKGREKAR